MNQTERSESLAGSSLKCAAFCILATFSLASAFAISNLSGASPRFQFYAVPHMTRMSPEEVLESPAQLGPAEELIPSRLSTLRMAPTRSSFLASWQPAPGATGYRLDVSTDFSFDSYVSGYRDLDVGNVTNRIVNRLNPATTYYYRVRVYNGLGTGSNSQTMTETTAPSSGLVIHPTFDSSITGDPNAAAIEAMITRAIALYQQLISDPITVEILFRYANTDPGGTPLPPDIAALSNKVNYDIPWDVVLDSLSADAKTRNDAVARSSLPLTAVTPNISIASPNGRAIALDTPPAMFASGVVGPGGPFDGIVTLNSDKPFGFNRPPGDLNLDAQTGVEHEMDEVLGLSSYLNNLPEHPDLHPQDLFSWSAAGVRNYFTTGTRYFSINNGDTQIVSFNQTGGLDYGDWFSEPCPQIHVYVQNAFGCKGQYADVTATSPEGINLDVIGYDLTSAIVPPTNTVLGNISTRGQVETGDDVLIGGFIITGGDATATKQVAIRAIGPTLSKVGVTGALVDPTLELHQTDPAGHDMIIATNNNWKGNSAVDQQTIMDANLDLFGSVVISDLESILIADLPTHDPAVQNSGLYTAIVRGSGNLTGVALVEIYDLNNPTSSSTQLGNISTRGLVGTGDDVLIGGFIVSGYATRTVVTAKGPSLTALGVANALQDPTLELHDSNGTLIVSNDNWKSDQQSDIAATGLAPTQEAESAIVMTLASDLYTAIVSVKDNTTGVALVEVYRLED